MMEQKPNIVGKITGIYRESFTGIPRDLWLLGVVALVNRSGTMVLPFISLYLTQERGLSPAEAGQLVGLYGLGAAAGAYLGGWMSDRIGSIRAQQASLVLGGVGFLVLSELRQQWRIAVAMLLVSAVVEAFRPAAMTAFAERSSKEIRPKAFAFLRLAVNLGVGIGPAAGGFLALYGYRYIFYVDAATCWLAALLLLKLRVESKTTSGRTNEEAGRTGGPWRDPPFLLLLGLVVVMASVLFQIFSTYPLYLREQLDLRENAIGLLLALNAMLIVLFEMPLIHVVQNRDRMGLIGLGAFLLATGFGLLPLGSTSAFLAFTVAVWTFGEMLALPVLNVVVAERASSGYEGQYMGLYTMAFAIAFIAAPIAGTYLYEHFGAHVLWFTVGGTGALLWLGVAVLAPLLREPRQGY